jgi:hypothetical protein
MKLSATIYLTWLAIISMAAPVAAQLRSPSQDFFEQGWEQLEREIQNLQTNPPATELLEEADSNPTPEVCSADEGEACPEPSPNETPQEANEANDLESSR